MNKMNKKQVEALKKEFDRFKPLTDAERSGLVLLMCRNGFLKSIEIAAAITGASTAACIEVLSKEANATAATYIEAQSKQLGSVYKVLSGLTTDVVKAASGLHPVAAYKDIADKLIANLEEVNRGFEMLRGLSLTPPAENSEVKETKTEEPKVEEPKVEEPPVKKKRGRPRKAK
jgi:hypothetical protein